MNRSSILLIAIVAAEAVDTDDAVDAVDAVATSNNWGRQSFTSGITMGISVISCTAIVFLSSVPVFSKDQQPIRITEADAITYQRVQEVCPLKLAEGRSGALRCPYFVNLKTQ